MKIEVTACDIDRKVPAKTYTIKVSDGRSISKDLCAEHAQPLEKWLEEAGGTAGALEPASGTAQAPVQPEHAIKKTAAARRRPKIVTLEQIEASKQR